MTYVDDNISGLPFWLPSQWPTGRVMMQQPDPQRQIYEDAFVRLVTAAVMFDSPLPRELHSSILHGLSNREGAEVSLGDPPSTTDEPVLVEVREGADLVTISPRSIRVTTALYHRWERFEGVLNSWLKIALHDRSAISASLWYLNEIRPSSEVKADEWERFVNLPVARNTGIGNVAGMFGGILLCPFEAEYSEAHEGHRHVTVDWAHTNQGALSEDDVLAGYYKPSDQTVLAIELATSERFDSPKRLGGISEEYSSQYSAIKDVFNKLLTDESKDLMRGS